MNKDERFVLYYDLSFKETSKEFLNNPVSSKKAFELMEKVQKDNMRKEILSAKATIYISDWNWNENIISILFNKSDKNTSNHVLSIPEEYHRRIIPKEQKEGDDFSAHIVIKLPKEESEPALLLLESCKGLSMYMLRQMFNHILRTVKQISPNDFKRLHPDGSIDDKGEPKRYDIEILSELKGHLSDDLKNDLEYGKIQSIELITDSNNINNIDQDQYIEEKSKILSLKLTKDASNKLELFRNYWRKKDDYNKARIRFITPEGVPTSAIIDKEEGISQLYVKKAKLDGFEVDLLSSYDKFYNPILDRMKKLLI